MSTTRTVTTRRIEFDRHTLTRRHFVDDDLLFSNILAVLSAMFPHGEQFFVDTVRRYRAEVVDPELRQQIGGFIGQESVHGREHDRLNSLLHERGYPTEAIDRDMARLFAVVAKTVPNNLQLAMTAAMEHVTAVVGEHLLTDPAFEHQDVSDELRDMLRWHALEECEHKAVAFDTLRAVDGNEVIRVAGMALTLAIVGPFLGGALVRAIASDRAARNPLRLLRSVGRLGANPFARAFLLRRLAAYVRPGFHPDDRDTGALVERWREVLFGTDGTLANRAGARAVA
ncbi:MAG: metal-dependent hydrolase [Acidimicrobiales bacterium]